MTDLDTSAPLGGENRVMDDPVLALAMRLQKALARYHINVSDAIALTVAKEINK